MFLLPMAFGSTREGIVLVQGVDGRLTPYAGPVARWINTSTATNIHCVGHCAVTPHGDCTVAAQSLRSAYTRLHTCLYTSLRTGRTTHASCRTRSMCCGTRGWYSLPPPSDTTSSCTRNRARPSSVFLLRRRALFPAAAPATPAGPIGGRRRHAPKKRYPHSGVGTVRVTPVAAAQPGGVRVGRSLSRRCGDRPQHCFMANRH